MASNSSQPPLPPYGDPDRWVEKYGDALFRTAMGKLSDVATAEDLVQETLLAALEGRDRFQGSSSFQTWLLGILKRKIADHYRHQKVVVNHLAASAGAEGATDEKPISSEFDRHGNWNVLPKPWKNEGSSSAKRPEELAQDAEFWNVVANCTGEMPEHLSRAFSQRTIAGDKVVNVCETEGISQKNLSVRLHRARLLIRRCLELRWFGSET